MHMAYRTNVSFNKIEETMKYQLKSVQPTGSKHGILESEAQVGNR
jgi:hypothetical protein